VLGKVVGGTIDHVQGGAIDSRVEVNEVGAGGDVTGLKIGTLGRRTGDERSRPRPKPEPDASGTQTRQGDDDR
jgi:hypothetical protein